MPVKQVLDESAVPVKIWTDDIDEGSKAQLANIASLSFIHYHVAAMPDVHLGIGATSLPSRPSTRQQWASTSALAWSLRGCRSPPTASTRSG